MGLCGHRQVQERVRTEQQAAWQYLKEFKRLFGKQKEALPQVLLPSRRGTPRNHLANEGSQCGLEAYRQMFWRGQWTYVLVVKHHWSVLFILGESHSDQSDWRSSGGQERQYWEMAALVAIGNPNHAHFQVQRVS